MQCVENAIQDLRFALRSWAKTPAFAIAAIGTLAIGTGANTAIFSVVSGALLRPLPFADPQTLVQLYETQPRTSSNMGFDGPVVFQDFDQWRTQSRLLQRMVTYSNSARIFPEAGGREQVATNPPETALFGRLGVWPLMGRPSVEEQPSTAPVARHR